jgi:hypothetical protein
MSPLLFTLDNERFSGVTIDVSTEQLAQQIQSVVFELHNFSFELLVTGSGHTSNEINDCRLEFIENWKGQSPKLRNAMGLVEVEFRRLLGSGAEPVSGRRALAPPALSDEYCLYESVAFPNVPDWPIYRTLEC